MIQVALDRAPDLLQTQTPQDYIKGLAVASSALQRARSVNGKGGRAAATDEAWSILKSFRETMEPEIAEVVNGRG